MNEDMIELISDDNGYALFLIKVIQRDTHFIEVEVYEVESWGADDQEPHEIYLYLKGFIKFNGCSNIMFQEGYTHLCGKSAYESHCRMMMALFEFAKDNISEFDVKAAE